MLQSLTRIDYPFFGSPTVCARFPTIEELITDLLPCLESHAEGRNAVTRLRRESLMIFFDRCVVFSVTATPDMGTMLDQIMNLTELLALGLETLEGNTTDPLLAKIQQDLSATMTSIGSLVAVLYQNQAGPWTPAEIERCHCSLRSFFDWQTPDNARAYVYALTGEAMADGLLGKERSLLIQAVHKCAEEASK